MSHTPTIVEQERKNRIKLAVYAYAYEYDSNSLISDHEFDKMCFAIDSSIDTGNSEMDKFFRTEFTPSTGMWIRKHPDIAGIQRVYRLMIDHNKERNSNE